MSYDIDVGPDWFNYTWNMRDFLVDFDVYPRDWDGKLGSEVAEMIQAGLDKIWMIGYSVLKPQYDASNGWGSVETAVEFLVRVRDSCLSQPEATVRAT